MSGRMEIVGRNIGQSVGISLSQLSDYERGEAKDNTGNLFQSPDAIRRYDAYKEPDSEDNSEDDN